MHRLPILRPDQVLGLVGANGVGKSTAIKILAGKLKPNLGRYDDPPDWEEIIKCFRGSGLQSFFTKVLEDSLKAVIKPQYVDSLVKAVEGEVGKILEHRIGVSEKFRQDVYDNLEINGILTRKVRELSGGELQRFALAATCLQKADIYMFDEPTSYLDIKQRVNAAGVIRSLLSPSTYVVVVEHDLSILDYLSDFVCILYGVPSVYGVVTMPFGVREGINIFLDGKVPTENLHFRSESLIFKISETAGADIEDTSIKHFHYPRMSKNLGDFHLEVEEGKFRSSQIIVLVGENGTGKTTFIRLLAGKIEPDGEEKLPQLSVSYKPQKLSPKYPGTVRMLLMSKILSSFTDPQFQTTVVKPLTIDSILDHQVSTLSGGELQRVGIILALGQTVDVYLIDEPSAYLDSEQRIIVSKIIRKHILNTKKTAFIVEHDFIMATYLADNVIYYDGVPSKHSKASSPMSLLQGMNLFLKNLYITFRRDPANFRPRINKKDSAKDKEQKLSGQYFYYEK